MGEEASDASGGWRYRLTGAIKGQGGFSQWEVYTQGLCNNVDRAAYDSTGCNIPGLPN